MNSRLSRNVRFERLGSRTGALLLTTALAACSPKPDSPPAEQTATVASATTNPLVQAVAADPDFISLVHALNDMSRQRVQAWQTMGELAVNQEALADDADFAAAAQAGQVSLSAYTTGLGINPATVTQQHRLVEQVIARHNLGNPQTAASVLQQAAQTPSSRQIILAGMEYTLRDVEPQPDTRTDCHRDCDRAYAEDVARAYGVYLGALGVSVTLAAGVVTSPVSVFAALVATAVYVRDLGRAQRRHSRCYDACDGVEPPCEDDDDCPPQDFCQQNLATSNLCIPDRGEGGPCTQSDHCVTNCCKWHPFGGYVFTGTCRPADKCN